VSTQECLRDLIDQRKAVWIDRLRGWLAYPDDVVDGFARDGFREYRREPIRGRCDHGSLGGLWEGLDGSTGSVASVMWVNRPGPCLAMVFIVVDGEPLEGTREAGMETWWSELDDEVRRCLGEGALAPAEIARRLGVSEDAATSLVTLLAREGKVRICLVDAGADGASVVRSFLCPFRGRRVTAEFRETEPGGRPEAVNWCSAFTPPTAIGCARRCLELDETSVAATLAA
jgi:hypothetical protein